MSHEGRVCPAGGPLGSTAVIYDTLTHFIGLTQPFHLQSWNSFALQWLKCFCFHRKRPREEEDEKEEDEKEEDEGLTAAATPKRRVIKLTSIKDLRAEITENTHRGNLAQHSLAQHSLASLSSCSSLTVSTRPAPTEPSSRAELALHNSKLRHILLSGHKQKPQ